MCLTTLALGYIDPNTSQHVFSLLTPLLAFLAATGGLVVTALVFVRHRIGSYFRRASWIKRIVTISCVIGVSAVIAAVIWWILR